jgi:vancomycin resistance protein VanW
VIFSHRTPLLRNLRNLGLQLQHNKVNNLAIAVKLISGTLLGPGESFSYWRAIGRPTARKGYKKGMVLRAGMVGEGVGGGLCQLSNLLYWMTLHTPLTVVERWRHSYDVFPDEQRALPFGSGATCSYPNIDLEFKNTTRHTLQLLLFLTNDELVGEWRCATPMMTIYEVVERDHAIQHEWWGGYTRHNTIVRKSLDARTHALIHEEEVAVNHAIMMYEPLLSGSAE